MADSLSALVHSTSAPSQVVLGFLSGASVPNQRQSEVSSLHPPKLQRGCGFSIQCSSGWDDATDTNCRIALGAHSWYLGSMCDIEALKTNEERIEAHK
jgi:hypothetical protein